jgi:MFS family permease
MGTLDSTVVAVALPTIGPSLHLSYSEALWIQAAYLLALSIFLIPVGRMADSHGLMLFYVAGTGMFGLFSAACGLSWAGGFLIGTRSLQGASAAFTSATSSALVTAVFPANERGRALGLNAMAGYLGLTLGPAVGGLIATHIGWRWIFFINVPIAVLNLASGWFLLRAERKDRAAAGRRAAEAQSGAHLGLVRDSGSRADSLDWFGGLCLALVLASLAIPLTFGPFWGWSSAPTLGLLVGFVVVLVGFVLVERRVVRPILDLKMIRANRAFAAGTGAALLNYMAAFAVTTLTAVFLEIVEGYSAQRAGLVLLTQPLFMVALSAPAGRLSDRLGSRPLATGGMLLVAVGMIQLGILPEGAHPLRIVLSLAVIGVGMAAFSAPNTSAVMGSVERRELSFAAGFLSTMRSMGQTISVALLGGIAAAGLGPVGGRLLFLGEKASAGAAASYSSGYRMAMFVGAGLAVIGSAISLVRGRGSQESARKPAVPHITGGTLRK